MKGKQILSILLVFSLIYTMGFSSSIVYAENDNGVITAISPLSDSISMQTIEYGGSESDIEFPTILRATVESTKEIIVEKPVSMDDSQAVEEITEEPATEESPVEPEATENLETNSEETTEPSELPSEEQTEETPSEDVPAEISEASETNQESVVDAQPEETTAPAEASDQADTTESPVESSPLESAPVESTPVESAPVESAPAESAPAEPAESTPTALLIDLLFPPMIAEAAELEDNEAVVEYVTETVITSEEITLENITWIIDPSQSSNRVFDSNIEDAKYVYLPQINTNYAIAAPLPTITVVIGKQPVVGNPFSKNMVVEGIRVNVNADPGVFPEDATLSVRKVSSDEAAIVEDSVDEEREDDKHVVESYTFDIKVLDASGNEIQPDTTKGKVKVFFELAEVSNANLDADIYHTNHNMDTEKLAAETVGPQTIMAETESFSYYTVEFSYETLEYRASAIKEIPLQDILNAVGLTGNVQNATSSNTTLFTCSNNEGSWIVTPVKAFSDSANLTVTIDSIDYVISLTATNTVPPGVPEDAIKITKDTRYVTEPGNYYLEGDNQYQVLLYAGTKDEPLNLYISGKITTSSSPFIYVYAGYINLIGVNDAVLIANTQTLNAFGGIKSDTIVNVTDIVFDSENAGNINPVVLGGKTEAGIADCTFKRCTFKNFNCSYHGMVVASAGTQTFIDCQFTNNCGLIKYCGSIYVNDWGNAIERKTHVILKNCVFDGDSAGFGGSMYIKPNATATLENCTIKNSPGSSCDTYRGAVYVKNGGTLILKGNTNIIDQIQGGNIYLEENTNFVVDEGFTGKVGVTVPDYPELWGTRQITTDQTRNYQKFFANKNIVPDDPDYTIQHDNESNHLVIYKGHKWQYTVDNGVITANCIADDDCDYHDADYKVELMADVEELSDSPYSSARILHTLPDELPEYLEAAPNTITYYESTGGGSTTIKGSALSSAPSTPGCYVAEIKWGSQNVRKPFIILLPQTFEPDEEHEDEHISVLESDPETKDDLKVIEPETISVNRSSGSTPSTGSAAPASTTKASVEEKTDKEEQEEEKSEEEETKDENSSEKTKVAQENQDKENTESTTEENNAETLLANLNESAKQKLMEVLDDPDNEIIQLENLLTADEETEEETEGQKVLVREKPVAIAAGEGAILITMQRLGQQAKPVTASVDVKNIINSLITEEEYARVQAGSICEIKIDLTPIEEQNVPETAKEVIVNGADALKETHPYITLADYLDITMLMRIDQGNWNVVTETNPVNIIIDIPSNRRNLSNEFYIIRAHNGESTLLEDLDNDPNTITISTGQFSTYALMYNKKHVAAKQLIVNAERGTFVAEKCKLCHICPTFLNICYFVWLAIIVAVTVSLYVYRRINRKRRTERIN